MEVYKYEVQDGLEDKIKNSRLAIACSIDVKDIPEKEYARVIAAANPKQIDLFYFESILASVGWNVNDAVFDKYEMWKARKTPADKPINFMHDESDIIGHMTSSSIVVNNAIVDDNIEDNIPDLYDIAVGSVIYKYWENEDKKARIANLIKEIADGKWKVSMECIFPRFDYAVITPDGQQKVIARNNDSSFLSKHLKFYGGDGTYNGYKVGMIMRDFVFSGKGIVDNPANKRSDVTACSNTEEVSAFHGELASVKIITEKRENIVMTVHTDEQFDAVSKELADLKAKANEQAANEVSEAKKEVSDLNKQVAAVKIVCEEKDKAIANLNEQIKALSAELEVAKVAVLAEKTEKIKANRLTKLAEKGLDQEKASALVAKFAEVSDELFDELVNAISVTKASESKKEEVKELEKEVAKAKTEEPTLTPTETVAETLRAKASLWISEALKKKNEKK